MGSSHFNEYARIGSGYLMHYFGQRDGNGDLITLKWYASRQELPQDVKAFVELHSATNAQDSLGEFNDEQKVERQTILMERLDTSGNQVVLDTEALVVAPDGSTLAGGRWGIERIDNSDEALVQLTLVRERTKRYNASGYER